MNIVQKLKLTINDAMKIDGDLIDFRIGQGNTFVQLVGAAYQFKRIAYGIDTFTGLTAPTQKDMQENYTYAYNKGMYHTPRDLAERNIKRLTKGNGVYHIIKGELDDAIKEIPENTHFSFALLDQIMYQPTADALKYLWKNMAFGGTAFIFNYNKNKTFGSDLAVSEFIEEHDDEIMYNEQLIINDNLEEFLIIKMFNPEKRPADWQKYIPKLRPLSVAMVLRTGGEVYNYEYVNALANGLRANSTVDYELVVLTDNPTGFNDKIDRVVTLQHPFPKWWGKVELFRPDIFGDNRVIYFDLDTIITQNIDDILNFEVEFSGLRDFYHMYGLGSGMMAWLPEKMSHVYTNFLKNPGNIINSYTAGDQRWIDEQKPSMVYLQDAFPNRIVSFKKNCLKGNDVIIPKKAEVVCFHGYPRPHMVDHPAIKNLWNP